MSDQLRHIVEQSVNDFISMFDGTVSSAAQRVENGRPLTFAIRLVLDEEKIRFEPSLTEIIGTVETLFDHLLVSADRIPKIETQLFSNGASININSRVGAINIKPDQCIKVAFENTLPKFTEKARNLLISNLQKLLEAPQFYLNEFDRHKFLVTKTADNEVTEFLKIDQTHDRMAEVILTS